MVIDYYAMLGVDPSADRAAVEKALAKQQPAWSSGTRNPKTKHTYQSYLDQIPAIRQALLGDPSARAAYDAELAAARRADHDRRVDLLLRRVLLRAARGGLTVSDRALLRDEAARLDLTPADLDPLTALIPPLPEAPAGAEAGDDDPPADTLDPVMRRQIRVALDHLRRRDLYDALGLSRDAPTREIAARADTERQRWMRKSQVTAEKTAWLEVVTLAQSHLTTPPARARYDRSLAVEDEETFGETVAFALKGRPSLDPGTNAHLTDEAAALGIRPERAARLIARVCRALGVARDGGPLGSGFNAGPGLSGSAVGNGRARLLRCRSCGGLTDFPRVAHSSRPDCRHCGVSLQWACPVCKRSRWVDEPKCLCGFRLENREPLVRHFEAAQQAYRNRDYPLALAHLKRVQDYAPRHVGARKGIERVKEKVAAMDRAKAAFEVARAAARLVAARDAAEIWGGLVDPAAPDWRAAYTDVTRLLRDAHALVARALERERSDAPAARALYRQALALAADLPDALEGLNRCPPDPPSDLSADFAGGGVRLRWSPPAPDGLGPVSYVILRKLGSAFAHPADGVRVGESSAPEFDDPDAAPGTAVAYAVVSRRGGVESVGAVALGPVFVVAEVSEVRVEVKAREVDLSWTPPPGAAEVRVVRKRGAAPTGPLDGDRVEALMDQAHDHGLEPERVYHYGIFAVYRTPEGRATASRGVFVSALPHTPGRTLDGPTLTAEPDGRVTLRWIEPTRGIVKVLRTPVPFAHPPGTRLAPVQVASLEGTWLEPDGPDQARDTPPVLGTSYYTPLTSWGGSVTVGHSTAYSSLADPSDLRAGRAGGQAHLKWTWGPHGDQTVVVYRQGAPPTGPDDPAARVETVNAADYARLGRHTIALPPGDASPWHVAVYALSTLDAQPVTSPGREPTSRTVVPGPNPEVTLTYQFRRARLAGRSWVVTLRTEPPGSGTPPAVLVTHPRTVPLSADDGTIAAAFPEARDGARFPLPAGLNPRRAHARIFPDPRADPDGLIPVRLRHPESDATRV